MIDNHETVLTVTQECRLEVKKFCENFLYPRIEKQIDFEISRGCHERLEKMVEDAIEKRFSFAIELLRSMNEKAK